MAAKHQVTEDTVDAARFVADEEERSGKTVNSFTIVVNIKADKEESSGFKVNSAKIVADKELSNNETAKATQIPRIKDKSEKIVEAEKFREITEAHEELKCRDTVDAGKFEMETPPSSVRAVPILDSENDSTYRTDFPNVGVCVIINNEKFDPCTGWKDRRGTDKDEEAVKRTFEALGYKIIVHRNLTKKQMKEELKKVSNEDHSENASFVCFILSHGNEEGICGTDKAVKLETLTQYFKGHESKTLTGKPKLFFLQACRGEKLDAGMDRDMVDASALPIAQKIPVEADFLYAYATAPGHYAWRNGENGSWFIQSLCDILPRYKDLELMQIMTRVNRKVAFDFESWNHDLRYNGKKAVPCISSMLTKEFYFP